jgi:UDP-N-acetylmuramoylalanine--D-glutamate ligase
MSQLEGKRVVIMGLGRFGGGVGAARYCCGQGADVLVTDLLTADELADSLAKLADLPIDYRLGEHNVSDFTTADLVVVNPAVDRRGNRFCRAAGAAGVELTSEIRLLVERLPNRRRTLGITGTAGKSTTTAMIGHGLEARSSKLEAPCKTWIGGNLGGSLLDEVDKIGAEDWVVLELSSFMLEDLGVIGWSPHIAVVTNISDNHLDRHGTMADYIAAKQQILHYQSAEDAAILGPSVSDWPCVGRRIVIDTPYAGSLLIPGEHNRMNAAMAVAACRLAMGNKTDEAITGALAACPGLPHRLQFVGERQGVRCYNDSKSTTPAAAMLAIDAFAPGSVHIILGGYDKQADMAELAGHAAQRCAGVYAIGATGPAIAEAVTHAGGTARECSTLDCAVASALETAQAGEVVLLSPACASWDQFENYEQRGDHFARLVTG